MKRAVLLLLLLTGAALAAGPDNGDHDARPPLPQIVEDSAEGAASCDLSQEERARLLRFLDRACGSPETDWHACGLAGHVRGMQLAGQCAGPQRLRLLVSLLGLGLLLMLGWMIWLGANRRAKEPGAP